MNAPSVQMLSAAVGQKAILEDHGLEFFVTILEVKVTYGQARFLVRPDAGRGRRWVELSTLRPFVGIASGQAMVRR